MNTEATDNRIHDIELAHTIANSWNYSYDEPECMDEDRYECEDYRGAESYFWSMFS